MKAALRHPLNLLWGAPLIALLFLVESFIHYPMLLASGDLPTDKDSIGIPMAAASAATPFLLLFLFLWALPAVIGARPSPRLFAWRRERPVRSVLGTLVYGGAALMIGISMLSTPFLAQGLYDFTFLMVTVPLVIWNLCLQAACVDRPRERDAGIIFD